MKFIIQLSNADYVSEYVGRFGGRCASTTPSVRLAKRFDTEQEAIEVRRKIKANIDSGAVVIAVIG